MWHVAWMTECINYTGFIPLYKLCKKELQNTLKVKVWHKDFFIKGQKHKNTVKSVLLAVSLYSRYVTHLHSQRLANNTRQSATGLGTHCCFIDHYAQNPAVGLMSRGGGAVFLGSEQAWAHSHNVGLVSCLGELCRNAADSNAGTAEDWTCSWVWI